MRERVLSALRSWAPVAIGLTAVCVLVYAAAQHGLRSSLDDPQLQFAQDAASRLVDGISAKAAAAGAPVDVAASLAPWVMVYDAGGKPIAGAAKFQGAAPSFPKEFFELAAREGENRATWQPRHDVRVAAVVEYWRSKKASGFVVTGRNMREVEARIDSLRTQVAFGWVLALAATFVATYLLVPAAAREEHEEAGWRARSSPS